MKGLKIIATIFFILLLVIILVMTSLAIFVSPNRFKPLVIEQVKKYTGRDLVIDGNLSWTLFPTFGVKVGHLELKNTPDFKQKNFAEVDSATVSVKLLPLLRSRVESDGVTLKGLKLNLIKNANGQVSWASVNKPALTTTSTSSPAPAVVAPSPKAAFALAISGIDVTDATVHWENEKEKQIFDLTQFELHLKEITLSKPVPMNTAFNFNGQNPNVKGKFSLTSDISLNLEKELYALHGINLKTKIIQGEKTFDINLKGDAVADMLKDKLQLDNLRGSIANLNLKAKAVISNLSQQPETTGHLSLLPFDLKKWLKETGQDVPTLHIINNVSGEFDFKAGTTLPSVDLTGSMKIDELKVDKITMTHIDVRSLLQKGILNLAPMSADFYKGNLTGSTKITLTTDVPHITLNAKLINMQAEPFMQDVAPNDKIKIVGAGNVDFQINTQGKESDAITQNLNGTAKINFTQGVLHGIDIGYLFDNALSLARKHTTSGTNSEQTDFGSLNATAVIHNGVIRNDDFKMDSARFDTTGKGTINLVNKTIQYRLQTQVKKRADERNELANMYGLPIPILISGNLNSPSIGLDTSTLMKAVAEQQLQKAKEDVREKFKDKIKDKLPGAAGDFLNSILSH